jgi:hypothetical protein
VIGGFGLDELGVDGGFGFDETRGDGDLILGDQGSSSSSTLYDNTGDSLPLSGFHQVALRLGPNGLWPQRLK